MTAPQSRLWESSTDHFKFDLCLPEITPHVIKREILSEVAKLFDPIGWFAPITIKCKMWIQRLWTLGLAWDQPIPAELASEFIRDMQDFGHLRGFRLQRFISTANSVKHEIHCFADASINAYATAVYLVTETANQERTSHLITAKTRVAPIKTVSLPRLELCAAQLGAKLTSKIVTAFNCLDLRSLEIFAWSDSTITLAWIKALPSKWNTFVANRVSDIQTHLPPSHWHHVPTKLNPADVASRGSTADELIKRKVKTSVHVVSTGVTILEHKRFSEFKSLRNTQAYILRFIKQLKSKTPKTMALSAQKLEDAKLQILRDHQAQFFTKEIEVLQLQKDLTSNHRFKNLNPFFDGDSKLLRVGGRLYQAEMDDNQKHQVLMKADSHLTTLLVRYHHHICLHAGPQCTLYSLRQQFWFINARKIVRQVIQSCVTCARFSNITFRTMMGPLPEERITPSKPFTHTGIDFAGPFQVRMKSTSKNTDKVYLALLVCLATKAIHLEVASDLSTTAYIAVLKRFVARRGVPPRNTVRQRYQLCRCQERTAEVEADTF